ncbi:RNA polymerase sigma factor [Paractinoplanes globisporus]|uniref:RNA polymerase sigma factor n=1 Tax=Paractinoplanes globisporus TaxID=113565 RepID=A0ABW6WIQ6_9ACTN|nr:sigma-70 family RNA polymerase sigma factor [Actinoplanes globisporus]
MSPPAVEVVDDHDLIRLSAADPEAFGQIFDRHAATIHRYLARRIGRTLADDLTGETFLIAFRNREKYDMSHADSRPWLYGIAANLLRGHQRAEIRQYRALARTGADPAYSLYDDSDDRVTAADQVRGLAGVLAELPAGERDVLTLVAQAQLSYPEVARALNIPVGTVRSRLHSARKRLRKALPALEGTIDD